MSLSWSSNGINFIFVGYKSKFMKLLFIMMLSFITLSCKSSDGKPNSWKMYNLKGEVKKLTEVMTSPSYGPILKKEFYYNKKGYITKIEVYKNYNKETETYTLSETIFIGDLKDGKQLMYSLGQENKDTIRTGEYVYVNDSIIEAQLNEPSPKNTVINIRFLLDSEHRNKKIETKVMTNDTEKNVETSTEYAYENKVLSYITQSNNFEGVSRKAEVSKAINEDLDKYGNPKMIKFIDQSGDIEYSLEKEYKYY
jgi:hypothetical protein